MIGVVDDVIAAINAVRFTPVLVREGYDQGQVDAFLDQLVQAVREERDLAPMVTAARFTPTRGREGYDMGEVDDFIEGLAGQSDPGGTPTYVAPATASGRSESRRSDDAVVQEVPGLLTRLFKRR